MATKTASIGSISHGTMREDDLIPTFLCELQQLDHAAYEVVLANYPEYLEAEDDEDHDFWSEEASSWMLESLFDALGEVAPAYCYFGSSEGDGSDYGFWPVVDSVIEDVRSGDAIMVNDTSEVPHGYAGYVLHVNDHDNCTLYNASLGKLAEVWSVV